MPTTNINANFTIYEDETYEGTWAFNWEGTAVVANYGTILGTIGAFDSWNAFGTLTNHGTIDVNGSGYVYGFYSPNWAPQIFNIGSWTVRGQYAVGVETYGSSPYVPGADVTNSGDWIVEGVSGAIGVYLNNGDAVVNSGDMIVSASAGQAIGVMMDRSGTVVNSGLIQASGVTSIGIALAETFGGVWSIDNSGTITAQYAILGITNGGLVPYFRILNTGTINGIIDLQRVSDLLDNRGTINGNVFMFSGDDVIDTSLGVINGLVYLEDGNDSFTGGAQGQAVFGGLGDDQINGGDGADQMYGRQNDDTLSGDAGADALYGGDGNDQLHGGADGDMLDGGNGADVINGGDGVDSIFGRDGDDVLDGGLGDDTMFGGNGADVFVFSTTLSAVNIDRILSFDVAADTIQLDVDIFTAVDVGALAVGAFVVGATAGDADDRIIYDPTTGALYYDADGDGAGSAVQFATLSPGLALTAADFLGGP